MCLPFNWLSIIFSTCVYIYIYHGLGSSVGTAPDYGLEGPVIESRGGGRDFPPVQTGPMANPASCTMGTMSFQGIKYARGVLLTTHSLLVPRSWKSRATSIPLPNLWATTGPVMGTLYLLFIYIAFCD